MIALSRLRRSPSAFATARSRASLNKQLGRALEISSNTVRNHVNGIIGKLDVSDRTEAATTAIARGIIEVNC
ncbi:MAG: hypothetical protein DMG70_12675 [Acidobacteria bacterium]|nr:MAG: hypothetical protein DMG70_12675 [Acidobacteriota bacterium]